MEKRLTSAKQSLPKAMPKPPTRAGTTGPMPFRQHASKMLSSKPR